MISQRLTIQETREDLDFKLLLLEKSQHEKKFQITDIADFLPVGVLINHRCGSNVYMNRVSEKVLNMTLAESAGYGTEYQSKIVFDKEEFQRINALIQAFYVRNDETEILSFFQKLKPVGSKSFEWMYITSKLYKRQDGKFPEERLLIACPVNLMGDMAGKVNRVLDENEFMKRNFKKFANLTKREKEILSCAASGDNNPTIADKLFISRHTVEQHRKNIYRKIECKNLPGLIRFAMAFDLIQGS